mgnify:CR=1 FL=1
MRLLVWWQFPRALGVEGARRPGRAAGIVGALLVNLAEEQGSHDAPTRADDPGRKPRGNCHHTKRRTPDAGPACVMRAQRDTIYPSSHRASPARRNPPALDPREPTSHNATRGDLTESTPQGRGSSGRRPGSRSASSTPSKRRRAGGARHSHGAVGRLPQGRERADGRHPSRVEAELDAIETITSTSSAQPVLAHHRAIETNHKERSPHVETRSRRLIFLHLIEPVSNDLNLIFQLFDSWWSEIEFSMRIVP